MKHQRLRCYQALLEVAKMLPALTHELPRGSYFKIDQLKRAISSAILNLSEGNARTSLKEMCRFFDIAIASIAESTSAIDFIIATGHEPQKLAPQLKSTLIVSYKMLDKLRRFKKRN